MSKAEHSIAVTLFKNNDVAELKAFFFELKTAPLKTGTGQVGTVRVSVVLGRNTARSPAKGKNAQS